MESTKEVLVVKSDNLLYFPSNLNGDLYKTKPFRNNGITFTKTLDDVHLEGQWDGTENTSGAWGVAYCNITLSAGTYTLSNDENYQGQTIINKKVDNAWVTVAQCGYGAHTKTFTLTEPTVIERLFWSNENMDKNVPIDMWMHPMLVEGDTKKDYEPYYHEYESTKEVVVRRSNNLFLPFTSNSNMQIDVPFSWSGTDEPLMTCTLQKDGNIRMRGTVTKGAGGGFVSITNLTGGLVFKAGKTYNFSIKSDCQCTMQLFRQKNGAWETIYQFSGTWAGGATKTFTEDTIPTRIFMNFSGSATVKAGDEIDVLINPMLVEGDTKQDYEPYYREYEATSMQINDFYPTGYVVNSKGIAVMNLVDFSNSVYNQLLLENGNTFSNDIWAYTPDYAQCEGNAQYYIGCLDLIPNNNTFRQYGIYFYDENKQIIPNSATKAWGYTNQDFKVEKTSPSNAKYMRIRFDRFGDKAENPYPKFLYVYKDPTA